MARFDAFSCDLEHPFLNSSPDYSSSRNGAPKSWPIGDMTSTRSSFRERSVRLTRVENERTQLIDDLIYQLEATEKLLEQTRLTQERDTQYNRDCQMREHLLQDQLKKVKAMIERSAYAAVLIDGDGLIFNEEWIRRGYEGGRDASSQLFNHVTEVALRGMPHLSTLRIVAKIYLNVKKQGRLLCKAGVIDTPVIFEEFIQGFNCRSPSFDMIDTGAEKGDADNKIRENFRIYLQDCYCHQILFGCSQSSTWYRLLEDTATGSPMPDHITLIESVPFEGDFENLKMNYKTMLLDDIFRPTKLSPPTPSDLIAAPRTLHKGPLQTVTASLPGLKRVESNGTSGSNSSTPALTWASMTAAPFVPLTKNGGPVGTPKTNSTPAVTPTLSVKSVPGIDRNRLGQRVDKFDPSILREDLQRVKKLKLCNIFFLQGPEACTSGPKCNHDHSYRLSKSDKKVLSEVARMTPCYYKMECEDPDCIYGHRCPQSKPGEKECWYKEDCRFWGWGHGIDTRIVKTTRV